MRLQKSTIMKRSEMIKKIAGFLGDSEDANDVKEAYRLLRLIEDAGMLPPLKEGIGLGVTGTMDHDGRMHFKFEWEPE